MGWCFCFTNMLADQKYFANYLRKIMFSTCSQNYLKKVGEDFIINSALNIFASSLVECDFFFPRKVLVASRKLWVIFPDSYLWDVLKVSLKRNLKAQALLKKSFKRKVLPIFENRAEKKSKNENKTMSVKIKIKVTFLYSPGIGTDRVNVLQ